MFRCARYLCLDRSRSDCSTLATNVHMRSTVSHAICTVRWVSLTLRWLEHASVQMLCSLRRAPSRLEHTESSVVRVRCRGRPDALGSTRPFVLPLAAAGQWRDVAVSTPAPRNGGPRKFHSCSAHEGQSGNHKTTLCELETGRSQTQNSRLGTRNFTPGGQNMRRRSPCEKTQARARGQEQGAKGQEEPGKQEVRWSRCIWR